MKPAAVAVFALAAFALAAPAQEAEPKKEPPPPPAKHVNQVSPEAKACIEAIGKAMYSPVAAGLKRLEGTMTSTEGSGTEAVTVEFREPADLKVVDVEKDPPNGREKGATESSISRYVRALLLESFAMEPFLPELASGEYDADLVPDGEGKALRLKGWFEGEFVYESMVTLDKNGLPSSSTGTEGTGGDALRTARTFEYARVGGKFVLVRHVKKFVDAPILGGVEVASTWTEVDGLRILTAMELKVPLGGPVLTRWKELTVNGKKVDLPPEEKPPAPKDGGGK